MAKVKNEIQQVIDDCYEIYQRGGAGAVIDYINEAIRQGDNMVMLDIKYKYCKGCDAEMPTLNGTCLVCGQSVPNYFDIITDGWDKDTQREQVEINCGENGKLLLVKTDEGIVIDLYGQNELVHTAAIFEDDMKGDDEDDENLPITFTDAEILQWKKDWGQSHSEITAELGYPRSHEASDGLLMEDYFWIEKDKRWYNKHASMFTKREQAIADYLRQQE